MSGHDPRYKPPGDSQQPSEPTPPPVSDTGFTPPPPSGDAGFTPPPQPPTGGGFTPPPPPPGGGGFTPVPPPSPPGRGKAIAALVLGIAAIVFSYVPFLGLAAGIVGIFLALGSKKEGFVGGMLTGGLVCSIIGAALSAIATISCIACTACLATDPFWMDPWAW